MSADSVPADRRPDAAGLDTPLQFLRGIGPDRAAHLARLGLVTVGDLLLHRPRRYEDRRHLAPIAALTRDGTATVCARVVAAGTRRLRRGSVFELILEDGTGRLHCRWWNLPFMERMFAVGEELLVHGKVRSVRPLAIDNPETERIENGDDRTLHVGRVVPVYPSTEGLTQRVFRILMDRAWREHGGRVGPPDPDLVPAGRPLVPSAVLDEAPGDPTQPELGLSTDDRPMVPLPGRPQAVHDLHFPGEPADARAARARLALDEFIALQLEIRRRRLNLERHARALPCQGDNRLMKPFLAALGFRLTDAQARVLREIRSDLGGSVPMRRLLQGDVGSGKTVVAAAAALMTLESDHHVLLMAPTEILAEQLHQAFRRWLGPLGVAVELRTGAVKTDAGGPRFGSPPTVVVGTHALLSDGFQPDRLGLVIIDEQHKFGVGQRESLLRKGRHPHLLVMTATPIPRTLGLTWYGDLYLSVLDERPAGRGVLRTHLRTPEALPKVWTFIAGELAAGRQAYVVYPRVDAGEEAGETAGADEVKAVTREHRRVAEALSPHAVGLLHGRLKPEEKEAVMDGFRRGRIRVLVATSVIEVGVDVPNASVMLIENAEQFGLAQLHQLRGRIGRGVHASHCILVARARTDAARERLQILAKTDDGFALAEADLRLRGPGDFLGRAQSGLPDLRFGDLVQDRPLVELARRLVREHLP